MLYRRFGKQLLDTLVALTAFLALLPVFLIVTLLLALANNGKPFFLQQRPGRHQRIFRIIKFKTMNDRKDAQGQLLPDADRLTVVGTFIRRTSLDEIPQLLNVIKGDMSLVGPRPLLVEYLDRYTEEQQKRHNVRPGITGWAQVNGRNAISWEEKFSFDVWYVQRVSLLLDLKILGMTLRKVVKSEGISSATSSTMEKFAGSR